MINDFHSGDKVKFNSIALNNFSNKNNCYKKSAIEIFKELFGKKITIDERFNSRVRILEDRYHFHWPIEFFDFYSCKDDIFIDLNIITL